MLQSDSQDRTIFSLAQRCPVCSTQFENSQLVCPNDGSVLARGLPPGALIAERYRFIETLGHGGMGIVLRAKDERTQSDVAIKMLLSTASSTEVERFRQEARAVSLLNHPNIVRLLDFGTTKDNLPFMVMEFIEGVDLATMLKSVGSLSNEQTRLIFDTVFDAMEFAHSRGVLHRDLKPSNVMVKEVNGGYEVKLVDFGIAKVVALDDNTRANLTRTGQIMGSPLYMSPEQALGKTVDARSDIYSATCMVYQALSGAPPIEGESAMETLFKHVNSVPLSLTDGALGKQFSNELEAVVRKGLQKNPADRQQSFKQLRADFAGAIAAVPGSSGRLGQASMPIETMTENNSRTKKVVLVAVVGACVVLSSIGVVYMSKTPSGTAISDGNNSTAHVGSIATASKTVGATTVKPITDATAAMEESDVNSSLLAMGTADRTVEAHIMLPSSPGVLDLNEKSLTDSSMDVVVRHFQNNPGALKRLNLNGAEKIGDAGIEKLVRLKPTHLIALDVGGTRISKDGIRVISGLASLEELTLDIVNLDDLNALRPLGRLSRLRKLGLSNLLKKGISGNVDLSFLKNLKQLDTLKLAANRNHISARNLKVLADCPRLMSVDLSCSDITSSDLDVLTKLPRLETLDLHNTCVDDEAIPVIAKIAGLRNLYLNHTLISDKGLKLLCGYADSLHIVRLKLQECALNAPSVDEVRRAFGPTLQVEFEPIEGSTSRRSNRASLY